MAALCLALGMIVAVSAAVWHHSPPPTSQHADSESELPSGELFTNSLFPAVLQCILYL